MVYIFAEENCTVVAAADVAICYFATVMMMIMMIKNTGKNWTFLLPIRQSFLRSLSSFTSITQISSTKTLFELVFFYFQFLDNGIMRPSKCGDIISLVFTCLSLLK